MNTTYHIEFTTPLFSKGMYDDLAEVRPASIRGQLHWWFRALGGSHADEHAIFGGVHGGATASKIVIRVGDVKGKMEKRDTLPHKRGGEASPKTSFLPGTRFTLHTLPRLGGLTPQLQPRFDRALEAWLLMGSLGLRTTRAAGSFVWSLGDNPIIAAPPASFADYEQRCRSVIGTAPLRFALLANSYTSAEAARRDCSDTIGGRDDRMGQDSLGRIRDPLGSMRPRKTSPLRFRIVSIDGNHRILALWDGRTAVTHNSDADLKGAIDLLVGKRKEIGRQLAASPLAK